MSFSTNNLRGRTRALGLLALAMIACTGLSHRAGAAVIFQDGFESGSLAPSWFTSWTNDGRAAIRSDHGPVAGSKHLILDDSVNDAVDSVSEATLGINLSFKRNVVLSFKAKSLGNEPHPPPNGNFGAPRAYDAVALSIDGGATWRSAQSLAELGTGWQTFFVPLDSIAAALGGGFGSDVRIRFSVYDNSAAPIDGIAIDEVSITADDNQISTVELPSPLIEGTGAQTGYVLLAYAPSTPLTLDLTSSPAGALNLPPTVTVAAGATSASFEFSVPDDEVANLTRDVAVYASAPEVTTLPGSVSIYDDEAPTPVLTVPSQLAEGAAPSNNAMLTLDRAPSVALTMTLAADVADELILPATVTVPAGQTAVAFNARANDDGRIDGNRSVTVTATADGISGTSAQTTTVDNEARSLSFSAPNTVQEDATAIITVRIPGTLTTPLTVNLNGINPAVATAPSSVTIPAGATSNSFELTPVNNGAKDGSRNVMVTASAATFTSASAVVTIRDDEVASYQVSGLGDIVKISTPVNITISPADVEGNVISGRTGQVQLALVLPDGTTQAISPPTVTLQGNGSWNGSVTLPNVSAAPLRLRASSSGAVGDSRAFDNMRVIPLAARGLIWDAARSRMYASVAATANSPYANHVVAIDPTTMQVTASVQTGHNPTALTLTTGGEALYAALDANGTIAKINLPAFTLGAVFPVGADQFYGTIFAEDMAPVAGQPNVLVVSTYSKNVIPRHTGVYVFDNGVARPTKTATHTGSNRVEPSTDPGVFFGFNAESTEYGFRKLKVDANGISQMAVNTNLLSGYPIDIIADGDVVASTRGVLIDGPNLRRVGTFPTSGPVRPELAANRVYFIEPETPDTYYLDGPFNKIGAYEPGAFSRLAQRNLPETIAAAESFLRWGGNGFAFRTGDSIVLINSGFLIPNDPPADLRVTIKALPNPATVGGSVDYSVEVINEGPNTAANTVLNVSLSSAQTLQSAQSSSGTVTISGSNVSLAIGNLPAGAAAVLSITTTPQSAGNLSCTAAAGSTASESDLADNVASKVVNVGYDVGVDRVNELRLVANNLLFDAGRNLLWATTPNTVEGAFGRALVAINPANGLMSDPFPLNGNPVRDCIALSGNGRYLYVGLSDVGEIVRVDLSTAPYTALRIPLGTDFNSTIYAQDIEVLDGDGTSFVMTSSTNNGATAYDGVVRRPNRTGIYTANRIEKTSTPNVLVSYQNYSSGFEIRRLSVTASGVSSIQSAQGVFSGYSAEIKGAGDVVISSSGHVANSSNLTLKTNLGIGGRPCLDLPNGRAYIVRGDALRAFDFNNGTAAGTFALPVTTNTDWALACVRWGLDGFAILGPDKVYVFRWSGTIPSHVDNNGDYIADGWAIAYFGSADIDPAGDPDRDGIATAFEYFFNTSPLAANARSVQMKMETTANGNVIHLIYPRRPQVVPASYGYEVSADLRQWNAAAGVVESIVSTQLIGGVQMQIVDAAIPAPAAARGFARLRWFGP